MSFAPRKIVKRVFIIANLVLAAVFLLACCNAFLPPHDWWFIALLGLSFPFLLLLMAAFLALWIISRSKWFLLPLVCLVAGYPNIRALLGFRYGAPSATEKSAGTLRVMTWNVTWFDEQTRSDRSRTTYRDDMFRFIRQQAPDILCFQEYVEPNSPRKPYNNHSDITAMGYPYSHIAYDYVGWKGRFQSGVAIFSKYPITDTFHLRYPGPKSSKASESLIAADVNYNGTTVRVYTTHLQSVLFGKADYHNLDIIKSASDSLYEASKSVIKKLIQAYKFREQQVDLVRQELDRSPHPSILCGDFNDVPNSYTYFTLKKGRKDAFQEAGKGIGRTFANVSRTLRIDYILADRQFEVKQFSRHLLPYSEHYPLIADLVLHDHDN